MRKSTLSTFLLNIVIFALYVVAGKLGLSLAVVNPSTSAIWAPTGIALFAVLIYGYRVIPAIFLGAFIVNVTTAGTVLTSSFIAIGNTLEAVTSAYLVKKLSHGIHTFDTAIDTVKFTFLAGFLGTVVSANIGTLTLILSGLDKWGNFLQTWTTWWLGDMGGSLVIAPLFIIWATNRTYHINYKKALHVFFSLLCLFIVSEIVFKGILPYPYLCIPIAVWIAFWFGQKGATASTILVAIIAIFYTLQGKGPFGNTLPLNNSLLLLQMFVSIFSITSLIFAATVLAIKRSEKKLESHEKRFQALIENSFDAVVLIDATSKISYASPSVKRLLGYTPEELMGMTGFNLVHPDDRSMTVRELAKLVLRPEGTITIEYRTMRKDGKIIWVEATGTNLLLDSEVNAVVINFRDITEEKLSQEEILAEKGTDEAMLGSIGNGVIATDDKGRVTMINEAAGNMLGWNEKELMGKSIVDVVSMQDESGKVLASEERPMTKVLLLGKKIVTSKTNYYVKKDGTRFPVQFTVSPITLEGKTAGTIEIFHDITQEKELERMKDEFISLASHELRTPMTAINGLLSMVLHGDYGDINNGLKRPLENMRISAERQIHLINDLLDVSRLQTGRINFKAIYFVVDEVISESIKTLSPLFYEKGIELIYNDHEAIRVYADPEWTVRIINNLLGNALKFTEKGHVKINVKKDEKNAIIEIEDTGIGLENADKEKLFGKFQQLNTSFSSKVPGSGLGLYLSRELARKMGAEVILKESHAGKGSTFELLLPLVSVN